MEVNLMTEKEVSDLLQKRRTALYNLRKNTDSRNQYLLIRRDIVVRPLNNGLKPEELTELFSVPENFISIQLIRIFLFRQPVVFIIHGHNSPKFMPQHFFSDVGHNSFPR